jgi:hypothetical protein
MKVYGTVLKSVMIGPRATAHARGGKWPILTFLVMIVTFC